MFTGGRSAIRGQELRRGRSTAGETVLSAKCP
jgi:hypothetical protein